MVSVDELAQRTIGFVKRYCIRASGQDSLYAPNLSLMEAYKQIQDGVQTTSRDCLDNDLSNIVQDSEEFVVIDIGSGFARGYTRKLAKGRTRARFYLVDSFDCEEMKWELEDEDMRTSQLIFRKKVKPQDDPERWVNDILRANGYRNVTYINRLLRYSSRGTELKELRDITRTRRVVVTGFNNPGRLSLATAREASYHRACFCFITASGIENMEGNKAVRFLNGFTDQHFSGDELRKFLDLVYEPYKMCDLREHKFDYSDDEQRATGIALKQLFALSLAKRFPEEAQPKVMLLANNSNSYGHPDHLIVAQYSMEPFKRSKGSRVHTEQGTL